MNIEALQNLRRVVQDAPEELLHMRAVVEEASCGTARCALGWCIVDPWFQENTKLLEVFAAGEEYRSRYMPPGSEFKLSKIFDVSPVNIERLFGSHLGSGTGEHDVTKAEVLWNIDELLSGRNARNYAASRIGFSAYAADRTEADVYGTEEDDDQ